MAPRPKVSRPRYVFAKYTTAIREPGSKYSTTIHEGSVWHAECPMVLAHPEAFGDEPSVVLPRGWVPPVEQATAGPGEVRDSGR